MNPYTVSKYLRAFPLEPVQAPEDLSWHDLALCAETDPEAFFPEKGGSTREAKRVCRSCEVRAECLEYALEHEDAGRFGIWGGMSERERRQLRRQPGRSAAAAIAAADAAARIRAEAVAASETAVQRTRRETNQEAVRRARHAGSAPPPLSREAAA